MKIQIIKFESVDSTNNVALRRIKKGKIKPTLIIAKSQKKGRGQYGRKWISHKGNIFMTVYFSLKKKIEIKSLSKKVYKLLKKSLEKFVNEKITIKLPNDLLIKGSKVCGILQETIFRDELKYLIIGVGINLENTPHISNYPTTYLNKYSKKKINKLRIINDLKLNFEKNIKNYR